MRAGEANRIRLLYFLVLSCTASWLPIFADYLKERGLTGIQTAFILSVTPFMMFTLQPFSGMLADKFGYKRCLVIACGMAAVSFSMFFIEGSFIWLFVVTATMSFFYNAIQPILDSLALVHIENGGKASYGSIRVAGALGWAVSGAIVGYFVESIDTKAIFGYSAAALVFAFVVAFSLKPTEEKKQQESQNFRDLLQLLSNKSLVILLCCVFLVSVCATSIWNFYSIYMKENGASSSLVGLGLSLQGLCELPLFFFSALIIRKLGIRVTLIVTVVATALRLFLYSTVKDPHMALFIEILHGIAWSLFWVVCVEYVNMLVESNWRATGQSLLYATYYGTGAIVGNFWTGFLYDTKMKMADIFLLNAAIISVVAVFILLFMKRSQTS